MNIANILAGLEKLVVEILLWLLFVPKTLFKVVADPGWVPSYVDAELAKDKERFDNYMSPILLFFICSVVIFVVGDIVVFSDTTADGEDKLSNVAKSLQGTTGYIAALGFLSLPLLFSLGSELFRGKPLTRTSVERALYIQCFYFSPFVLSAMATDLYETSPKLQDYIIWMLLPLSLWFVVVEVRLFAQERHIGWVKAVGVLVLCLFTALVLGLTGSLLAQDTVSHDSKDEGGREEFAFTLPETALYEVHITDYDGFAITSGINTINVLLNKKSASCAIEQTSLPYICEVNGKKGDTLAVTVEPDPDIDIVLELKRDGVVESEGHVESFMAFLGSLYFLAIVLAMAMGFWSLIRPVNDQ
jgi:hypothetical protein